MIENLQNFLRFPFKNFSFSFRTSLSHLLDHPRPNLSGHKHPARPSALVARPHRSSLASLAIAGGAQDLLGQLQLGGLPVVEVLQRDGQRLNGRFAFARTARATMTVAEQAAVAEETAQTAAEETATAHHFGEVVGVIAAA